MTTIEWTDMVWNPVTGCDKVSEGCRNCYAESIPVFVKQLGSRPFADIPELETWPLSIMDEHGGLHLKNHKGGDPSEWPTDLRVQEWPYLEGRR